MKKPAIAYTIADEKNMKYAKMLENSLRKFHTEKELPLKIITGDDLKAELANDPNFFYRATPVIGERLLKEYDLVLKLDADQIITGDLNYILNTKDYDVGTVMNWNRIDPKTYGIVQGWGIDKVEYFNCGLVAMRSEQFVHHWTVICFTPQFGRLQMGEQDLLNILCYYGNYNVRCFDHGDGMADYYSWHGLISKGEWLRAEMKGDKIIVPPDTTTKSAFAREWQIRVIHWAGGKDAEKMNYKTRFSDEVSKRLDYLVSNKK
jgi:hypothetical protein